MMPDKHIEVIKSVLDRTSRPHRIDIGANYGFYSIEDAERRTIADDIRTDGDKGGANVELFFNAHQWCSDLVAEVERLRAAQAAQAVSHG